MRSLANGVVAESSLAETKPRSTVVWLGIALALAATLRSYGLGTKSFWLDETISAILAQTDRHTFTRALIYRQGNMTLYYTLLRGWRWFGESEFIYRLFSVIAGVGAVFAIYWLGKILFGPKAGRIAALLLSVHAFHIRYSQEARGYSLLVFLTLLSCFFFVRTTQEPAMKDSLAYVITSVLMVYAQVFGGLILLVQWISIFLAPAKPRKTLLASAASIALLIAPLAYCLLFLSDRSQLAWLTEPTAATVYRFCLDFTGDGGLLLLMLYVLLIVAAVAIPSTRSQCEDVNRRWTHGFLLLWLLMPATLLLAVSLVRPAFEPRYLIMSVPAIVLLAADGLCRIQSRLLSFAATTLVVILSLGGAYSYYRARSEAARTDDWRDATQYVLTHAQPGDAVLFSYSEERLAFDEYEYLFKPRPSGLREFPDETELQLLTRRPSRPTNELIDQVANQSKRVWVPSAYQENDASRRVDATLQSHFIQSTRLNFGFVHVDVLRNDMSTDHIAGPNQ